MHNPTKAEIDNDSEITTFVQELSKEKTLMSLLDDEDADETFQRWDSDIDDDEFDIDYDDFDDDDAQDTFERFHDARRGGSWEDE